MYFLFLLTQEERRLMRPEPEACDFLLSAFLTAARSVGDVIVAEEGEHYTAWFEQRRCKLTDEELRLLKFTNTQRVRSVHIRGADTRANVEYVDIVELQRELEAGGGMYEIFGGVPGNPAPRPKAQKVTQSFSEYPSTSVSELCQRYVDLLSRLVGEYETSRAQHVPSNT